MEATTRELLRNEAGQVRVAEGEHEVLIRVIDDHVVLVGNSGKEVVVIRDV